MGVVILRIVEFLNKQLTPEEFIKEVVDYIKDQKARDEYTAMIDGIKYYNQENTAITERRKEYYNDKVLGPMNDPYKANHKMPSGYMKLLVDQKVNYSINENLAMDELPFELDLSDICIEASKKAKAYVQFYTEAKENNVSELKYKLIPSEQCFPVYLDNEFVLMIREYKIDGVEHISIYTDIPFIAAYEPFR